MNGAVVRPYLPLLRGEITATVRLLLPGASDAAPWLRAALPTHMGSIPALLELLEPSAARYLSSAMSTAGYLVPVEHALSEAGPRPTTRGPGRGTAGDPQPSSELRTVRDTAERQVDRLLGGYRAHDVVVRRSRAWQVETVQTTVRTAVGTSPAASRPDFGGWLLLASVYAVHGHPLLPRPGRRRWRLPWNRRSAARAGMAFEIGETFLLAMALDLLHAPQHGT